MFYYPNLNIVYCPIERTASRSIQKYFFDHDSSGYITNSVYRHVCDPTTLNGLNPDKIYISTRHPWDRFCSMFAADQLKTNAGFNVFWSTIDEYLDFYAHYSSAPFLLQGNAQVENLTAPHAKLINGESVCHFYRSQSYYFDALSTFALVKIKYEALSEITQQSWSNPSISVEHIGQTENEVNSLWTLERENKLKSFWGSDYVGYDNWEVV
jgi:hypothetical protein